MNMRAAVKAPSVLKDKLDGAGLGYPLRQAYVRARMVGEYAQLFWRGQPQPEDNILIGGGGRSGTTWLAELLCRGTATQEIFEPLIPFWNPVGRELTGWRTDGPWLQGHYLASDAACPHWRSHLHDLLSGRIRNYWTDANRTSLFPRRYLVKEIRANLMLGFIARQLGPKVIFIVRNPYDVIASRMKLAWRVDLSSLIEDDNLVNDYLGDWVDDLRTESDPVGRHAAWWAVENYIALSELRGMEHSVVVYEELAEDPVGVVTALRKRLELEPGGVTAEEARQPSRMGVTGKLQGTGLAISDNQSSRRKIDKWVNRSEVLAVLPNRFVRRIE